MHTTAQTVSPPPCETIKEISLTRTTVLSQTSWKDIALKHQREVDDAIPPQWKIPAPVIGDTDHRLKLPETCGILLPRELEISGHSATRLLELIHNGTYSAVEVTTTFCKRAAIAHQAVNCVALPLFDEALKDAAKLDRYMQENGRPKGPLHGLPVSVKEHIDLSGTPSTAGLISHVDAVSSEDALIVKILREAGAVFHVKTTNPQTLMALETESNLYGTTVNPHNVALSSGGSSGGEGALIAMRGSLLGIGTDMGGSIRAPSGFCGIYGLKPSVGRLPHGGLAGLHGGMENIVGTCGPMATCIEDLRLFCKSILNVEPWRVEPAIIEKPWVEEKTLATPRKLKIGLMWHDGHIQPHPPVTRHLQKVMGGLQSAGHTVVPWSPQYHHALVQCISLAFFVDAGEEYYEVLKEGHEPAVPVIRWILNTINHKAMTTKETWKLNQTRQTLQNLYAAKWNSLDLDAIICPVHPSCAPAIHEAKYSGYTSVFNILDYSAAVFPVGHVDPEVDTWENFPPESLQPLSDDDAYFRATYTGPRKYAHAPVSLQVVTRRLQEEKLLEALEEIEKVLS